MTEKIVITSSKAAIRNRKPKTEMIHHSDRGGQYAGKEYRKIIKHAGMKQSMSRARDCYDNAFMESCFGTIKNELEMTEYKNYNDALKDIRDYIATTISISNAKPVQTKFQLKLRDRVAP